MSVAHHLSNDLSIFSAAGARVGGVLATPQSVSGGIVHGAV